jgi:hypothetical protein
MAYTVRELIARSYYLSGIVSRDLNTASASQTSDGLFLLNALLAIKTANNRLIPYYTFYTVNATPGVEQYFVPNLISIESITFNLQTVRFSMLKQSRKQYFGAPRVDNINSLPFNWHMERVKGGANFFVYYLPASNYPIKIWGKFSLSQVTLDQDLSLTLDDFYIEYLRIALAEYICADQNVTFQSQAQRKLDEYENIIIDISPQDYSVTKLSTLTADSGLNWAQINFPGWVP